MTDKKLFIEGEDGFSDIGGEYSGVYAGGAFCQDALPEEGELETLLEEAKSRDLSFHLVTPYLTESYFSRAVRLVEKLAELAPGSELIANDLGLLDVVAREIPQIVPVAGRVQAYQRTDPQVPEILAAAFSGIEVERKRGAFSRVSTNNPGFARFLKEKRVNRIEIQNPMQGVRIGNEEFKYSLHVPYVFVSSTRFCPPQESFGIKGRKPGVYECSEWCADRTFRLSPRGGGPEFLFRGNTVYYENQPDAIPDGVDRIVVHKHPS